jgi:hypothetical protein
LAVCGFVISGAVQTEHEGHVPMPFLQAVAHLPAGKGRQLGDLLHPLAPEHQLSEGKHESEDAVLVKIPEGEETADLEQQERWQESQRQQEEQQRQQVAVGQPAEGKPLHATDGLGLSKQQQGALHALSSAEQPSPQQQLSWPDGSPLASPAQQDSVHGRHSARTLSRQQSRLSGALSRGLSVLQPRRSQSQKLEQPAPMFCLELTLRLFHWSKYAYRHWVREQPGFVAALLPCGKPGDVLGCSALLVYHRLHFQPLHAPSAAGWQALLRTFT